MLEPVLARAETQERQPARGGRPRRIPPPAPVFPKGIRVERVLHDGGYAIRLTGAAVTAELVDQVIAELQQRLDS